uniref:RNA helicase n=1 Tax=Thermogemmatispora argillosa TaxID=2045280 RepID=A0A455T199_9CHLR|nr:RNA helicase [Thermogemmatispora argillosa]
MASVEELRPNVRVRGLRPNEVVTLVSAQQHGSDSVEVVYRDGAGRLGSELVFGDRLVQLTIVPPAELWSFQADGERFRLVSEAYRIRQAYLFDPLLAIHTSLIEPLPHQITAVYETLLPRQPLRYVLADDPGAGKTIMTGLLIKELQLRGALHRCLVVAPGNLVEQWQDELRSKFQLPFEILTNDRVAASPSGNPFLEMPLLIARLDKLARDEELKRLLEGTSWDLVVFDEAHKLSATFVGDEAKYTKRYRLGELLGARTSHLLLLTATPHNGKDEDFQLFLRLLDPDRFAGRLRGGVKPAAVGDLMRHLLKEQLYTFEGKPLFPERYASTLAYQLSPLEQELYQQVTEYVRLEFNRADKLQGGRRGTVGFALTILQRRLASSPEAIYRSLQRRRRHLQERLAELRQKQQVTVETVPMLELNDEELEELEEDAPEAERERVEEHVVDLATAAQTMAELEQEIRRLEELEQLAERVRRSGTDRKWEQLSKLLQDERAMFDERGQRQKLVIFTEHRDTLLYLEQRIRALLGRSEAVVTIHGDMDRLQRKEAQERFTHDPLVQILVATDAAGEGINLQRAHLMVNYDLPWNPNRLEQRFGRIHRIGQQYPCYLWNLVALNTREGDVYYHLLEKLDRERKALGGQVFDVLGRLQFDNLSLRDLIVQAIRYGDQPEVRARLERTVERALDRSHLQRLLEERALTHEVWDVVRVRQVREEMERAQARRLQPHFVATFFLEAFKRFGGRFYPREPGRYELTYVPQRIRERRPAGRRQALSSRYERVTFEKALIAVPGKPPAELLCPGHPLLEAVIDLVLAEDQELLQQGAMLLDRQDAGREPRLLFYLELTIQDGRIDASGERHVVARQLLFVECDARGEMRPAGYAPFLNYDVLQEDQKRVLADVLAAPWLQADLEEQALSYAIREVVPRYLEEVQRQREEQVERVRRAVRERLTQEIIYWDQRAAALQEEERQGKVNARLNAEQARQRSQDYEERLRQRERELELERTLVALPPRVLGAALVVPQGLLLERLQAEMQVSAPTVLSAEGEEVELQAVDLERNPAVERLAMAAVMEVERALGFEPRDVSQEKRGYDIESRVAATGALRFVEVKGRTRGAATVFVTRNEIMTALNQPERFVLAVVLVEGEQCEVWYVRRPFEQPPDRLACGVSYKMAELLAKGERVR